MTTYDIAVQFERGYIADPYWPEIAKVINIGKESGMNRAKSPANRRKALEEHLRATGMTLDQYDALVALSARPFYTDDSGAIVIPENHVMSFLVATCDEARSAQRPCNPEQVRSRFIVTPWETGKDKEDGVWERFATVSSGTGQKLSNQRGLRSSKFISKFTARGQITFEPDYVNPDTLRNAIAWGGQFVGIGASRKMGWGRFALTEFAPA